MSLIKISIITLLLVLCIACGSESGNISPILGLTVTPEPISTVVPIPSKSPASVKKAVAPPVSKAIATAISLMATSTPLPSSSTLIPTATPVSSAASPASTSTSTPLPFSSTLIPIATLVSPAVPPASTPTVVPLQLAARWSEDNGSGTWGEFWTHARTPRHPWSISKAGGGQPVRAGAQSFRFERRTGYCGQADCGAQSERTELGTDGVDRPGDNTWYAWSIYHQNYKWLGGNVAPIHGQFKTTNTGHQYAFFNMDEQRGMVINFDAFEGWGGTKVLIPKSQINNRWNDIRVHAKWSTGADGIFQIWVNGVLKVDRRGRNMVNSDPVMFRFGIYAPQANRAGSGRPTQVVYYDELMRGGSCQSVSQFMSCRGGGGSNPPANGGGNLKLKLPDFVSKRFSDESFSPSEVASFMDEDPANTGR